MRRRGTVSAVSSKNSGEGEQGFWPSYADMMSSVALILFFLMLLSYIQNLVTGNDLQNTQEVLAATQAEVEAAETQLAGLEDELNRRQSEIEEYALQIVQQTERLEAQEKLIGDQEKYLKTANAELVQMRNQMQTIAVLRLSILEQIKDSIVQVMGDASKVSIGENGNIILSDSVLFDLGSSAVKPDSTKLLNELVDVFYQFLSDPENAKYVDSIVISGHTDSTGTSESNRQLSTDRANSVLNYLLSGKLDKYSEFFCAAGYGETRPVASNDTDAGMAANRRIEISMILKDDTVLDIVNDYLKLDVPDDEKTDNNTPTAPSPSPTPNTVQDSESDSGFSSWWRSLIG